VHLRTKSQTPIILSSHDTGLGSTQGSDNFLRIAADGGDDPHPADNNPSNFILDAI
jgi:hypothetical protein